MLDQQFPQFGKQNAFLARHPLLKFCRQGGVFSNDAPSEKPDPLHCLAIQFCRASHEPNVTHLCLQSRMTRVQAPNYPFLLFAPQLLNFSPKTQLLLLLLLLSSLLLLQILNTRPKMMQPLLIHCAQQRQVSTDAFTFQP